MTESSLNTTPRDVLISSGAFSPVEVPEHVSSDVSEALESEVFGQPHAIKAATDAILRSEAGIGDPDQPKGTMFFLGPTGVGKTELSIAIAKMLFGENWRDHFKKIDCGQFQEEHSVNKLSGGVHGFVGYGDETLINPRILENGAVILFDETEKADIAVHRWLLPIVETGQTTAMLPSEEDDPTNPYRKKVTEQVLDFRDSYIIFTSNIGAQRMQQERKGNGKMGFHGNSDSQTNDMRSVGIQELKRHFKDMPEFLGRIGESNFIVFNELEREHYRQIVMKFIDRLNSTQRNGRVFIDLTTECLDHIVEIAVGNGEYGARDIKDTIEHLLVSDVARIKVGRNKDSNSAITADYDSEMERIVYWQQEVSSNSSSTNSGNFSQPDSGSPMSNIILPASAARSLPPESA